MQYYCNGCDNQTKFKRRFSKFWFVFWILFFFPFAVLQYFTAPRVCTRCGRRL